MKHDDLERDPLWDLLRQSPGRTAGPRFADDVVRAARLTPAPSPWWRRTWLPVAAGGLLAGATALALVVMSQRPAPPSAGEALAGTRPAATGESFGPIQDDVETEVLLAAADHLASYSDDELVSLIGF